jgi:cytochrome oxidase Cu insertion factor (SCO1/SenC/PrrC family)
MISQSDPRAEKPGADARTTERRAPGDAHAIGARVPRAWIAVGAVAITLLFAWFIARAIDVIESPGRGGSGVVLAQAAASPQVFGEVAPFTLTERSGASVRREDLLGEPWVACCIFTRCTGPCPAVTDNMRKLQERLKGTRAKLVSFSVDPEWDTPDVLKAYASKSGADPKRWLFLTGATADIDSVIRRSFLSPVERDATQPVGQHVSHRTQLVAVDKLGRVRGFYSGETDADLDLLAARVKFLEREEPSAAPAR